MSRAEWMRQRYGNLNPLTELWRAQPDNLIGGWCVTMAAIPGTPADDNPPIADFCTEEIAAHVARLHNVFLSTNPGEETPWNRNTMGM